MQATYEKLKAWFLVFQLDDLSKQCKHIDEELISSIGPPVKVHCSQPQEN